MSLINLQNVTKTYAGEIIINNLSWQLENNKRIGLIGINGIGKTTLFRLILGNLDFDKGTIHRAKHLKIGYLAQENDLKSDCSLFDEMLKSFMNLHKIHSELEKLAEQMLEDANEEIMNRYGHLQEEYEHLGGYTYESNIKMTLRGLGFTEADFNLPVNVLSGGQKSRAALAQILLCQPNLLLLDEPTNHLDLDAIEWLEKFLSEYKGSVIIISHDRYFLDNVTKEIAEMEYQTFEVYKGNYSEYIHQKAIKIVQQTKEYQLQKGEIARIEEYIRKNIEGQKHKQAQSRRKKLIKTERLSKPTHKRSIKLHFTPELRGGNRVLSIDNLAKSFDDKMLFRNLNINLNRGDRLGIIGANGTGKTTLLNIITGEMLADTGEIKIGTNISVGYYKQQLEDLNLNARVIDEIWQIEPNMLQGELRNYLARFLFIGEDVFKCIGDLSGGEQSRVQLAKLILARVNFLILDEPTNHLDIFSRIVLENALKEFDGTILLVSHDRYFLNQLVNQLLVLDGEKTHLYLGNYAYYEEKKLASRLAELELKKEQKIKIEIEKKKNQKLKLSKKPKKPKIRLRKLKEVEEDIAEIELNIEEITLQLSDTTLYRNGDLIHKLNKDYKKFHKKLAILYDEWEKIVQHIED